MSGFKLKPTGRRVEGAIWDGNQETLNLLKVKEPLLFMGEKRELLIRGNSSWLCSLGDLVIWKIGDYHGIWIALQGYFYQEGSWNPFENI